MDVTTILPGRWALSRIIEDEPRAFTAAASLERIGRGTKCYFPPLNPTKTAYALPYALVRLPDGATRTPSADIRLFPNLPINGTLGDLTLAQRNQFRAQLEEWLQGYTFTDWDGLPRIIAPFSGASYLPSTPIAQVIRDVFRHCAHSVSRPKPILRELHNTEYLDDFATDPFAGRWTQEAGTWTWDSTNFEVDGPMATTRGAIRYSQNGPGSIEHEAQATCIQGGGGAGEDGVGCGACRFHDGGTNDWYFAEIYKDDSVIVTRLNAGARTRLQTFAADFVNAASDWITQRMACSGTAGNNVVIDLWYSNHGASKPSDPGWIGTNGSPDTTYTDSAVDRLDDSTHAHCGIAYHGAGNDWDPRYDFFKQRAISDRAGAAVPAFRLSLLGVGR